MSFTNLVLFVKWLKVQTRFIYLRRPYENYQEEEGVKKCMSTVFSKCFLEVQGSKFFAS